ncbi:hypothetical protein CTI14_50835, partial [Methylobacterium radiotolerans]
EITLRNNAMQSRSTVSGEEAMELLHSGAYQCDAMLVDVIMPGMSGIDVCRAVKADGRYGGLPVILMSATWTTRSAARPGRSVRISVRRARRSPCATTPCRAAAP